MAAQAAKRINKVGFLVAMQEEAAPFIGALKLQKRAPHARETRPRLFRHFATRRRFRLYASPTIDDMRPSRVCAPATHVSLAGVADARVGAVRAM